MCDLVQLNPNNCFQAYVFASHFTVFVIPMFLYALLFTVKYIQGIAQVTVVHHI